MKKQRPTIAIPEVRKLRHEVYAATIQQYHIAMNHSFYLEAITLLESIISDRLESLFNEVLPSKNVINGTLGSLLRPLLEAVDKGVLPESMKLVLEKLWLWRQERNEALHGMAKSLEEDFYSRYEKLEDVADEGYDLFYELDRQIRKFRKI